MTDDTNLTNTEDITDPVLKAIKRYEKRPSIIKFKNNSKSNEQNKFKFTKVTKSNVKNVIDYLDTSKVTTYKGIPAKALKENSDIYLHILTDIINNTINTSVFPKKL